MRLPGGILLLCLLAAGAGLNAQVVPPETRPPWPPRYENTPSELLPFAGMGAPFHRYFTEAQPFLGPRPGKEMVTAEGRVRVGLLLPAASGSEGIASLMLRRGVELAFAEAAAVRKVGELPVELVLREDAPLWGSAANGMVDLCVREGVVAVIGSIDGAASHVALRVALKAGVFLLNTASTDPTLTETAIPWLLRCLPDDRQHAYRLARLVVQERGWRRLAVLRSNDRYGRMGIAELLDAIRRLGAPALVEMRYQPGDETFDTQVDRIRAVRPEAVLLWGDGGDLGRAVRALRAGGIQAPVFGPDRLVSDAFLEAAGEAAEGAVATYPFDPSRQDSLWSEFQVRFKERFGVAPEAFAAFAYDGAGLLLQVLRKSGPDRVALRDALAEVREYRGVTGTMVFGTTHNNLAPLVVALVEHGTFRFH